MWHLKEPPNNQNKLEKEEQIEEITLPNFKNFYKPTVNTQKTIHIDITIDKQINGTEWKPPK